MHTLEERLQQWQRELLDFSNRNRLLNFRPSTSRPDTLELIAPEANEIFQLLTQGKTLTVIGNDETAEDPNSSDGDLLDDQEDHELSEDSAQDLVEVTTRRLRTNTVLARLSSEKSQKVLLRLLTRARAAEQDQGINTLFAVFGLLKWQEMAGTDSWQYAPLVMLPLKIEEHAREGSFRLAATGDDAEFNLTLAERLRRDLGLDLALEVDDESSLESVLENVRSTVARRPGWEVLCQVHIGHFQFYKLRMYTDLLEHASLAVDHDIVQALGSELAEIAPLPDGVPNEADLDRVVRPENSFTILDADGSQLRAIQAATRGAHLIIQGPPGTGKSQTIVNIIAECIAAGKSVLFVSEKAAALEVVHRRLGQHGLGEFCLMLHSHKANKREIITELAAQIDAPLAPGSTPQEQLMLSRLQEERITLDAYAEALHAIREPLHSSVFWVHSEIATLQHVPLLTVPAPSIERLTHETLAQSEGLFDEMSLFAPVLHEGSAHPWSGIQLRLPSLTERQLLRDGHGTLKRTLEAVRANGTSLATDLGLPFPRTLTDLHDLVFVAGTVSASGQLRESWFARGQASVAAQLAGEARQRAEAIRDIEARLSATYRSAFLEIDPDSAIASYEQNIILRLFSSSHNALQGRVITATIDGKKRRTEEVVAALRESRTRRDHLTWFATQRDSIRAQLDMSEGQAVTQDTVAWTRLERSIDCAIKIVDRFGSRMIPPGFIDRVCGGQSLSNVVAAQEQLRDDLESVTRQERSLDPFFTNNVFSGAARGELETLARLLDTRLSRFDDLDRWIRAMTSLNSIVDAGLEDVVDALLTGGILPEQWGATYRRRALSDWLDSVVRSDPVLQQFDGQLQDRRVSTFRRLDEDYVKTSYQRARRAWSEKRGYVTAEYGGEPGRLRYEANKRTRHLPLRRLFQRIPNLLTTLKPCLMMSPLSVAQYLPADLYHFDVVIFDEASQVKPHDAIGAIIRGRQLIVAGDSRQLPPTSFFDRTMDDAELDEEQDLRALESILDALNAKGMPEMRLLWHYRSRHEDLIAYSNHHFYDRALITFPSPTANRTSSMGVRMEFVEDGRYEDERDRVLRTPMKVNRVEARRVAEIVMEHARNRPQDSLLVVTLGMNQRDVVDEEIHRARLLQQDLEDFFREDKAEPFYVKPLEQVQGDERDVIIISVGYGKNAAGVLSHNFGPINQQGGERRLNVLVTRARKQIVLVSSIRYSDIDPTRTQNRGPQLLRNYLEFAERGPAALAINEVQRDGEYESPFEEHVGEALKRAGYTVHRQVGSSKFRIDLAVVDPRHPDRYILGIECDGKTYHQSKTARDRDRLRQEMLEGLGWTFHRIWSTEWIRNPDRELARVVSRIQEIMQGNDGPDGAPPQGIDRDGGGEDVVVEVLGPGMRYAGQDANSERAHNVTVEVPIGVPYQRATVPPPYSELLDTPHYTVLEFIVQCVDVEGPIHHELLQRRVTELWGYRRRGSRIAQHLEKAIALGVQRGRLRRVGEFFWPIQPIQVVPRAADDEGNLRDIQQIPDEEIAEAVLAILIRAFSLSPEDLVVQASRVFGYQRTGPDIRERMLAVARDLYKAGRIDFNRERVQLNRGADPMSRPAASHQVSGTA